MSDRLYIYDGEYGDFYPASFKVQRLIQRDEQRFGSIMKKIIQADPNVTDEEYVAQGWEVFTACTV